jgi:hypothetical protein
LGTVNSTLMEDQEKLRQKTQQEEELWKKIAQQLDDEEEFSKFKEECGKRKICASDVSGYCEDGNEEKLKQLGLSEGPRDRLIRSFKQGM